MEWIFPKQNNQLIDLQLLYVMVFLKLSYNKRKLLILFEVMKIEILRYLGNNIESSYHKPGSFRLLLLIDYLTRII